MTDFDAYRPEPVNVGQLVFGFCCAICAMGPIFAGYWIGKVIGVWA